MLGPNIPIPEIEQSHTVYSGYFNVREDVLKLPQEPSRIYSVLMTASDAAVVLAETEDGLIVLNKEYRHPTGKWIYGCPGGSIDPGESPLDAAQRELLEETGYSAEEFTVIGSSYPFPAICNQCIHFVLAKKAKLTHPVKHEPFELIQVELKTPLEIQQTIQKGSLADGILCTALYFRSLLEVPSKIQEMYPMLSQNPEQSL